MKQNINFIPVGIAFFISAILMLMIRLNFHEMDFVKGAVSNFQSVVSKETGVKLNLNSTPNNARYSSFHLKGVVYNSDSQIDKWVKDANDLKMPK